MISEVDLPINDTKNGQVRIFKNRNLAKSSNLEPKLDPLMKSKMLYIMVYSELAYQGLS